MRVFLFFSIVLLGSNLLSQESVNPSDSTDKVKYSPDFRFKDGVYISFDQVKLNKPIPLARIISDYSSDDLDYFSNLTEKSEIAFADDFGVIQTVATSSIWGYSRNGFLYINYESAFYRIPVVGAISHFVAEQTVYHDRSVDPYYYNNYNPINTTYKTKEIRQFILDFETGQILPFSRNNFEIILVRDNDLYIEYMELKKSQRKKRYFLYMRRYNDRNSLYFPKPK
ncbi:MAG: hypothetical protein JXR58_02650 [Bacteroidales bacterium]|nr:hypothetical protein [Bacteroidales bacterium]